MKTFFLILLFASTCIASDTLSVAKRNAIQMLSKEKDEAERKFLSSLTLQQMKLRDNTLLLEGELRTYMSLAHDTLKVKR
jgi:hypothetical protein